MQDVSYDEELIKSIRSMIQRFIPIYEEQLLCPFCRIPIDLELKELTYDGFTKFLGGQCDCGAVYVFDYTGLHLGQAYEDALLYTCRGDWDYAMSLEPEVDYTTRLINPYRELSKRSLAKRGMSGQEKGKYFFIKILKK